MNLLKTICVNVLIWFVCFTQAQTYKGKVIDASTSAPLEFANVILLQRVDSSFVTGTITDSFGMFSISAKNGDYLLKISFLGYQMQLVNVKDENTGTISLSLDENILQEVTVDAQRPIIKMENGGISTDIQNSKLKNMGNAVDVLGLLPFVNRKKDEITVFGKGTPLIYINNRLVRNNSELELLNSNQIKKVTVITNPGTEYDATVKSVIRIEMIKEVGEGLSGNFLTRVIKDMKLSHNEQININYRYRNLDIFGMVNFRENRDILETAIKQTIYNNQNKNEVIQQGARDSYVMPVRANIGTNYTFNSNHSIGARYENFSILKDRQSSPYDFSVYNNDVFKEQISNNFHSGNKAQNHYLNAYYAGKITGWISVKFDLDFASGKNNTTQNVDNLSSDETETIVTKSNVNYNLIFSKLALTSPLFNGQLQYGNELSRTVNKQNFTIEEAGDAVFLNPNNNTAKQRLRAFFITYQRAFGSFEAETGIRYENVKFDYFVSDIKEEEPSRIYNNFFPSANMTYKGKNIQMQLGYRQSTQRPSYNRLRNAVQYNNPYTYESGNAYLKPTYINTLSYILMYRNIQFMSDFNFLKDLITFFPVPLSDEIILYKPDNLKNSKNITVSCAYSTAVGFWQPELQAIYYQDFIKYGNPEKTYNQPFFMFKFNHTFTFNNTLQASVNFDYRTRGNAEMIYLYDNFNTSVHLSKLFLNNKLRVNLNVNDIFRTSREKFIIYSENIEAYANKYLNTQSISLSISYNFNATRSKYQGERASDELNRL
jgi:hypothetical protein